MRSHLRCGEAILIGEAEGARQQGLGLAHPAHASHRGGLRDHALGDHRHHVESLCPLEGPICPFDRKRVFFGAHVALGQPRLELDDGRIRVNVTEDLERLPDLGQALVDEAAAQQEFADPRRCARGRSLVADASSELDRFAEMGLAGFVAPCGLGRDAGSVQQLDAIGRVGGYLERLIQEGECLVMRVERGRTIGSGPECNARLGRDRGAFIALGAGPVRVQVMGRQDAGDLVVIEAFEVARGRQVPCPAVAA